MIGTTLGGRYRIREKLGEGGMGVVFVAWDEELDRSVAVKVLSAKVRLGQEFQKRFQREFQSCARLSHGNVISIFDHGELDDGTPYYVMEYLPHPTLRERIDEGGAMETAELLPLLRQVLSALGHLHGQGIVHRDLKPSNVVVTDDGRAVLLDFGVVRDGDLTVMTETGQIIGTPSHASPELIRGDVADGRSDIFQFGVMAYEALTGRLPFDGESLIELSQQIQLGFYPAPSKLVSSLDPSWDPFLASCMATEREGRYSRAEEAERDLGRMVTRRSLAGSRRSRRVPALLPRPSSPCRAPGSGTALRARRFIWGTLLLLVLGLVGSRLGQVLAPPIPPTFLPLHLKEIDSLEICWRSRQRGLCTLRLEEEGQPPRRLQFDLARGCPQANGSFRSMVKLRPPLVTMTRATLELGGRALRSDSLDGAAALARRLKPIRSLKGKALENLCRKILAHRSRLNGAAPARRKEVEEAVWRVLAPDLAHHGLDERMQQTLRQVLPCWLRPRPLPLSPRWTALHGLQVLEMTLARATLCFRPPWGAVCPLLGLTARPGMEGLAEGGWLNLASLPLARPVGRRLRWTWMSSAEYVSASRASFIGGAVVFGPTTRSLLQLVDEYRPDVELFPDVSDLTSRLDVELDVSLPVGQDWPPAELALELVVRLYSEEQCLRCSFPKGSVALYNVSALAQRQNLSSSREILRTQTLHHPLDPAWLRPGKNRLGLHLEAMPGNEVVHALSLRRLSIVARWEARP